MFIELPKKAHDLAGRVYGRLTVLGPVEIRRYVGATQVIWRCRCECGNETDVAAGRLRRGESTSCGCRRIEVSRAKATTHGGTDTPEYRAWYHAKGRCFNPGDASWVDYGGRGIKMCDRWRDSFEAFLEDMGPRPEGTTIDRIDNNGHYEPGNCRWATAKEQNNNRRMGNVVTAYGETKTTAEWSRAYGVGAELITRRIKKSGWSPEKAISTPSRIRF